MPILKLPLWAQQLLTCCSLIKGINFPLLYFFLKISAMKGFGFVKKLRQMFPYASLMQLIVKFRRKQSQVPTLIYGYTTFSENLLNTESKELSVLKIMIINTQP